MNCTVAGGTSPTAVTLWPSTTVEKAELEPTVVVSPTPGGVVVTPCWTSTNTETEATPSLNTRWSTGPVDPGRVCAARTVMRKPGGRRIAPQARVPAGAACSGPGAARTHWKPSVAT